MIVVTTPTGHIGSQVVQNLLAAGQAVRIIARNPAKIAEAVREKVEIVQGSSDDEETLMRALEDAESLSWSYLPRLRRTTTRNIISSSPGPPAMLSGVKA